jgi:hypothetical protein
MQIVPESMPIPTKNRQKPGATHRKTRGRLKSGVYTSASLWIYTMNRCPNRPNHGRWHIGATWALACLFSTPLLAQNTGNGDTYFRPFPPNALRGVVRIVQPPEILLNGKPDLLSPGSRIRNTDNRIVLSLQLLGQDLKVNYTREAAGGVHDVWILTPAELAQDRSTGQ